MTRQIKALDHMNADSLRYLAENTDITYLAEGSIARSLVEASNLEIAKVREFIASTHSNVFINSAQGVYLDLIGEMLGVARLTKEKASVSVEDRNIKLSVVSGSLGDKFPHPTDKTLGLIPAGFVVQTNDGSLKYTVPSAIPFPSTAKEVYISAIANDSGSSYNIGKFRLTSHTGPSSVNVTNLASISNGGEAETDRNYRYRLSNAIAAASTANEAAIRLAVAGIPDISRVVFNEYARGAGTFDAMLVPVGNKVSARVNELAKRSIESVAAFGVSGRVTQPDYVTFKLSVQLIPATSTGAGTIDANRLSAKTAILDYFETIPLGGEFIVNRLRAAIIDSISNNIKDIKIIDLCFNNRPRPIRNFQLTKNQLFTPAIETGDESVIVL